MFTETGWMLENVNFSIALHTNFNVTNFWKIANVRILWCSCRVHRGDYDFNDCAFWIAQVSFAFEFECNRPNGNSVTICHQIAIQPFDQIFSNLKNGNSVTNSHWIAIRPITLKFTNDWRYNLSLLKHYDWHVHKWYCTLFESRFSVSHLGNYGNSLIWAIMVILSFLSKMKGSLTLKCF